MQCPLLYHRCTGQWDARNWRLLQLPEGRVTY
jgi:hypothetical protein